MRFPVRFLLISMTLAGLATIAGCSQRLDPDEYGEVITEVPEHLNKPFPMPELEPRPSDSGESDEEAVE
ncbi:MAG: hypothetical protein DWQ37_08620 [Planctomycetota bacterium]|nr:MAG: hypothetical protein DWQ37_08620 [Planctomycetota bacterium]